MIAHHVVRELSVLRFSGLPHEIKLNDWNIWKSVLPQVLQRDYSNRVSGHERFC